MNKDQLLRDDITNALDKNPAIESAGIGIGVKNGIVSMTGTVPSHAMKRLAERIVQDVVGVTGIVELLEVKLPSSHERTDADLAAAAAHTLHWDTRIPQDHIKVKVEDGWLTLSGDVDHGYQRMAAEDAVHSIVGVRGVTNSIMVKPFLDASNVMTHIEAALKEQAERGTNGICVQTCEGVVTLTGTARNWLERDTIAKAAWGTPGVSSVHNFISVGN